MSFESYAARIEAAVDKAENGSEILFQVANGDEFTEVPTTSGPVPSVKKWFLDNREQIADPRTNYAILEYSTYAEASDAAATLPDGQAVEVRMDETKEGRSTRYASLTGVLDYQGLASEAGSTGFKPQGVSSVSRTVEDKLFEFPSVEDQGGASGADTSAIHAAITQAISSGRAVKFNFNATVRIPTDAPTLQAAINAVEAAPGVTVTLHIEAGHVLTSGFRVTDRDCSFMRITSTDPTVTVSPTMTLVSNTDLGGDGPPRSPMIAFLAVRSKMPTWNILVDMAGLSCMTGYELDYGSDGVVLPGKGVINTSWADGVGGCNCRVTSNSRLTAGTTIWTGAKAGNIAVTTNSLANLQNANASTTANEACLDVSRGSVVHALGIDVSNGAYAGIYARRSFVSAQQANFTNCFRGAWASAGSFLGAPLAVFDGCTTDVTCDGGSWIGLDRAQKSGADLNPANSSVQGPTSGTQAPRAFNIAGGYGMIAYSNNLPGNAEYLTGSSGSQTVAAAGLQNVAALTYATALNLTGKRIVRNGVIFGANVGVRITIDGNVVLNDGTQILAKDSGASTFSMVTIPPCKCESSILIEAYNRDGSAAREIAWRFYHTGSL